MDDDSTGQRVLHMIGNAHIDPVWLWHWPEGYQEARATFWSAVTMLDEYPDFVFTCNQVVLLSWVEESDPELFERIKQFVAAGRWVLTGGWWVEPDCNVPTGESFVRQGLVGQRYLLDKFGVKATVGMNVDPFGHNGMLPQILRKQGMTGYCFLRPGPHELQLPGSPFWWESPDGSRVMTHRIPHEYCGPRADLAHHTAKAIAQLSSGTAMVFYGVGNHGGGPTRANLESIRRLNELGTFGPLQLSSPDRYFAAQSGADLPVWSEDLQHHARGCYSAHSGIKRWVRRAENALLTAETWATVAAAVADVPYPLAEFDDAWRQVLFNQFHDILPGSAIESSYDDARDQLGAATTIAARATNRSLQSIARQVAVPTDPETQPVLVFNPHPWPLHTDVAVELALPTSPSAVVDDTGRPAPTQRVQADATVSDPRRQRILFSAEIPPLGYRMYRFAPGQAAGKSPLRATDTTMENDYLSVELDRNTAWLRRLVDKRRGIDVIGAAAGPHSVVAEDSSDTWGHDVVSYARPGKPFRPHRMWLVENGPVRAVIRVESRHGDSTLVEDIALGAHADHLSVRVILDWHEQLTVLKLRFPTALQQVTATWEIPFGFIQRPTDGQEQPGQTWIDVTGTTAAGEPAGLAIVNEAKFGYDVSGADIGVTIARSPVYAWHDPRRLSGDETYSYQDQGRQQFRYLVVPHTGDRDGAALARRSAELARPAQPMFESFHDGRLPAQSSFASATQGSVRVSAIKRAADGSGDVVIRAYESAGQPQHARFDLTFIDRTIEADFAAHEIKTFRISGEAVAEVDLIEFPVSE